MFFEYRQNNSGGSFGYDLDAGISMWVIIEADNADSANKWAETIGLYFDHEYEIDCDCCGARWSEAWEDEGTEVPEIYGVPIQGYDFGKYSRFPFEAFVHYADGRFQAFGSKAS